MPKQRSRRAVLGTLGAVSTAGLAGCSEVSNPFSQECSFGDGETKQQFDNTHELSPGETLAFDIDLAVCDQFRLTVTLEEILEDPRDAYHVSVRVLLPEMYETFQKTGEIESFTSWDSTESKDSSTDAVQKETFYYNRDRSLRVETIYVIILNRPAEPGGVIQENRPVRVRTTGQVTAGG